MKGPIARIRRRTASGTAPGDEQPTTARDPATAEAGAAAPAEATAKPSLFGGRPATPQATAEQTVVQPPAGQAAAGTLPADTAPGELNAPSFRDRGRLRRRLRYLRRVRELGFRDLGGLVFDLDRFGRQGDHLVRGKLSALRAVDDELRALERALDERRDVLELREPGIAACPRCGALHGSDARYCPSCGVGLRGPRAVSEVAQVDTVSQAPVPLPPPAGPTPPQASPPVPPPHPLTTGSAPQPAETPAAPEQPTPEQPAAEPTPAPPAAAEAAREQEPPRSEGLAWSRPAPAGDPAGERDSSLSWAGEDEPTEILRPSDRPDAAEHRP